MLAPLNVLTYNSFKGRSISPKKVIMIFKSLIKVDSITCVSKNDGIGALIFIAIYAVLSYFGLKWILRNERYIYYQIVAQLIWLAVIVIIVIFRKQGLSSLGFNKEPVPYIAVGAVTVIAIAYAIWQSNYDLIGRWFFYLIAVGGLEEVLFRGFAYPRVAKLFNSPWSALILTGLLFGAMHQIAPMIWNNAPWYGVFSQLGGGLIGTLFFLLIYASTGNITNAILVHAALDFSANVPFLGILSILYIVILFVYKKRKRIKKSY